MATTVKDLRREAKENANKKVWLFNPLAKDFKVQLGEHFFTLHSMDSEKFPFRIARHIKRHLITAIANKRKIKFVTPAIRKKIEKEIEVKL